MSSTRSDIEAELIQLLTPYKKCVEQEIKALIPTLGKNSRLREACEYALLTGGKRFRPAIVFMIAEALQLNRDVTKAALAVEFFHTASLIADDLPCMDNDDLRRGKPTVHKAFDEAIALLASFSLIALAFEYLAGCASELKKSLDPSCHVDELCCIATREAGRLNGIFGLTTGQYLDLYPLQVNEELILEIIEKKTVVLFELSFVLGWLFGGGEIQYLDDVKKAAFHFGVAFQILDDLDDYERDAKSGKLINYAVTFGREKAKQAINDHIALFQETLLKLKLSNSTHSKGLDQLGQILCRLG